MKKTASGMLGAIPAVSAVSAVSAGAGWGWGWFCFSDPHISPPLVPAILLSLLFFPCAAKPFSKAPRRTLWSIPLFFLLFFSGQYTPPGMREDIFQFLLIPAAFLLLLIFYAASAEPVKGELPGGAAGMRFPRMLILLISGLVCGIFAASAFRHVPEPEGKDLHAGKNGLKFVAAIAAAQFDRRGIRIAVVGNRPLAEILRTAGIAESVVSSDVPPFPGEGKENAPFDLILAAPAGAGFSADSVCTAGFAGRAGKALAPRGVLAVRLPSGSRILPETVAAEFGKLYPRVVSFSTSPALVFASEAPLETEPDRLDERAARLFADKDAFPEGLLAIFAPDIRGTAHASASARGEGTPPPLEARTREGSAANRFFFRVWNAFSVFFRNSPHICLPVLAGIYLLFRYFFSAGAARKGLFLLFEDALFLTGLAAVFLLYSPWLLPGTGGFPMRRIAVPAAGFALGAALFLPGGGGRPLFPTPGTVFPRTAGIVSVCIPALLFLAENSVGAPLPGILVPALLALAGGVCGTGYAKIVSGIPPERQSFIVCAVAGGILAGLALFAPSAYAGTEGTLAAAAAATLLRIPAIQRT